MLGDKLPPHHSGSQGQVFAHSTCPSLVAGCSSAPHCLTQGPGRIDYLFHLEHCWSLRQKHALALTFFLEGHISVRRFHQPSKSDGHLSSTDWVSIIIPQGGAENVDEQQYNRPHHSSTVYFLDLMTSCLRGASWDFNTFLENKNQYIGI